MTDLFVLMQLPNAGDDLQAIKKGVMELADLVVINKADIDAAAATRAQAQIAGSLRLFVGHDAAPRVLAMSALKERRLRHVLVRGRGLSCATTRQWRVCRAPQAAGPGLDVGHRPRRLQADFKHHPAVRQRCPKPFRT